MSRRGLTLTELLAATAIVAILAAVTAMALEHLRKRTTAVKAAAHIRTLGQAVDLFVLDNKGKLPQSSHQKKSWVKTLKPYLEMRDPFLSPGETVKGRTLSYAINDFLTSNPYGAKKLNYSQMSKVPQAAQTMIFAETAETFTGGDHFHFADSASGGFGPEAFKFEIAVERYSGGGLYLFADGHVEQLSWPDARARLGTKGSRFVHPAGSASSFGREARPGAPDIMRDSDDGEDDGPAAQDTPDRVPVKEDADAGGGDNNGPGDFKKNQ